MFNIEVVISISVICNVFIFFLPCLMWDVIAKEEIKFAENFKDWSQAKAFPIKMSICINLKFILYCCLGAW